MKKFFKKQDGLATVEASFVVPIVLMIIFLLMCLGFIMYQQTVLRVVANDTAAAIAQVYASPSKDPFVGYTDTQNLSNTDLYRNINNALSGSLDSDNNNKANWYAKYRLSANAFYRAKAYKNVQVEFENMPGSIMQKVIVVKLEATYDLSYVRFFGVRNSDMHIVAYGRAVCMDLLDTSSTMSLFREVGFDVLNGSGEALDNVSSIVKSIEDFANNLFK